MNIKGAVSKQFWTLNAVFLRPFFKNVFYMTYSEHTSPFCVSSQLFLTSLLTRFHALLSHSNKNQQINNKAKIRNTTTHKNIKSGNKICKQKTNKTNNKNNKHKHTRQKAYETTIELVWPWPTTPGTGASPEVWLTCPVRLHQQEVLFPLKVGTNCRRLLGYW